MSLSTSSPKTPKKPLLFEKKKLKELSESFDTLNSSQFRTGARSPQTKTNAISQRHAEARDARQASSVEIESSHECDDEVRDLPIQPAENLGSANFTECETRSDPSTEKPADNVVFELHDFDLDEFNARYRTELTDILKEEATLREEFDKFSEAFTLWARSAANRDVDRASKRLKTRERYVELAEESLDAKKEQYVCVVEAFKNALNLLGR